MNTIKVWRIGRRGIVLGTLILLSVIASLSYVYASVDAAVSVPVATNTNTPLTTIGSGFTYQGSLKNGGSPANGQYDLRFALYDALTGGNQVSNPITLTNQTVTGGLFTVTLDFGAAFQGAAYWMEIAVRQTGVGAFTTLSPRQQLTAVPYAMSLMPGAVITGTTSPYGILLNVINSGGNAVAGVSGGVYDSAVYGLNRNITSTLGVGVKGEGYYFATGAEGVSLYGYGLYGHSTSGRGVYGTSSTQPGGYFTSTDSYGVWGSGAATAGGGVAGISTAGSGVNGSSTSGYGVVGTSSTGNGVYGSSITNDSVVGESNHMFFAGVFGKNVNPSGTGIGVRGDSFGGHGVEGRSTNSSGVYGTSTNNEGARGQTGSSSPGVEGYNYGSGVGPGVRGDGNGGPGVYGISAGSWAGYFEGNVHVTGTCCFMGAGTTQIDHPLDPANMYLNQSAVESPDMKTIYDGIATLDATGEAWVDMPSYFQSLNQDFRYQLTPIGAPGRDLYIAQEIQNNRFKIAGGKAGMKVSWQVTGIRHDPYARQHPVPVEQNKPANEKGKYLHPAEYGQPETMGIGYEQSQRAKQLPPEPPAPTPGR